MSTCIILHSIFIDCYSILFSLLLYLSGMKRSVLTVLLSVFLLNAFSQDTTQHFFLVKTTGPLPFIEYGLGEDRLGGAKMTYLDTNIVLKVTDSTGAKYKVQLSKYHTGYVTKTNVKTDSSLHYKPYYLSNSWKVYGDDQYDYVTVMLDGRLPYHGIQQIDPSRIVIDIFGATSNTNWITQLQTVKEIKNAWYEQTEDDVLRVIIELKHKQHWGCNISYDSAGKKLMVRIKRQPATLKVKKLFIAIDPGHGGTNSGAEGGTSKVLEKEYTLKFANALNKYLTRKHVKVFMTRTTDTTLDMPPRTQMLRQQDPSILISLHLNSSGNPATKGVSTYYRYIGFRPLTQAILNRMEKLGLAEYGNVGNFNFSLSGPTEYPNCLVEIAFLSNAEDEQRILDPDFHKAVARQIYRGIRDWLKQVK